MKQYEDKIGELTAAELKSETASIVHTLIQEAESRKNTFLQKIGSLSSNLATPAEVELLEILSREPEFCNSFYCYKNSIFKIEQDHIKVITQKYELHLQPKILISCALIKNNKLSCETPWEVSNAAQNRQMWYRKVPGACKSLVIVQWRLLNGHHA